MNKIEIRLANTNDSELIALLARITFTETFGHLFRDRKDLTNYFEQTFSVEKIEKSISNSKNIYWVSFVDRLPVGYAKLKLNSPSNFIKSEHLCQLQKIYVLKDYLSMKIGYKLHSQLLEKARIEKNEKIWLSVLHSNERAITFYLKNGFKKIGDHTFQIGKENFDFIAMEKSLN